VGKLLELPLKLEGEELALFARRYILGSRVFALLEEKFGERDAQRVMRLSRLDYLPRLDADRLHWRTHEVRARPNARAREGAIGTSPDSPRRIVRMVNTESGWKVNLDHGAPAILVLDVQDAPWRIRVMQKVIDELKAGMIATIDQAIDRLVPLAPDQAPVITADRSTPAGAVLAAAEALDKGDVTTLADSFEMMGGDDAGVLRAMAEQAVLERKVEHLVRARFPPEQAERIVRDASLRRGLLVMYQNVDGWVEDGDVARAALKERWYDVVRRMVRRDGVWRIEWPPRSTIASLNDPAEERKQQARMGALQEVLDHPERFATPGALLDALDENRREAAQEVDPAAEARLQIEQMRKEMANNPPRTPQEAEEQALGLAILELGAAVAAKDAHAAARYYFAAGDDGSYALARERRVLAAMEFSAAASKELGNDAGSLLTEFGLISAADDLYGLLMSEPKIQGDDRAIPRVEQGEDGWMPVFRKSAGQWKIDVTEETGGNPQAAAKRAEDEAKKLAELTAQVKAGKFSTVDQLRKAMKDAGITGIVTPPR
jgi:hypothetical protein